MLKKAGKLVSEGPDLTAAQEIRDKKLSKQINELLKPAGYVLVFQMSDDGDRILGVHFERWSVEEKPAKPAKPKKAAAVKK